MTTPTVAAGENAYDRPIAWTPELSVGVPEIDADHKVLIELIGQINHTADMPEAYTVVGTVLAALSDYTEYHFSREERMQEVVGFPTTDTHRECHDILRQQVQHYLALYTANPEGVDTQELFRFLQRWLFEHILKEDMQYAPYCANNPKASEAVIAVGLEFFMDSDTGLF
jgi:hemerythrin-like metal-binding protein